MLVARIHQGEVKSHGLLKGWKSLSAVGNGLRNCDPLIAVVCLNDETGLSVGQLFWQGQTNAESSRELVVFILSHQVRGCW